MLDKVLTGENVKVNGEIVGRRPILRTLHHKYTFNQWRDQRFSYKFDFFVQIIKYVIVPSIISEQYL